MAENSETFFKTVRVFDDFEGVTNLENYHPLPDGWALVTGDIVNSTGAIRDGRYKTVNMAGAAIISAIVNALGDQDLPFVFGGDGATVAVPPSGIKKSHAAISAMRTWAQEELDLEMRAAVIPISAVREAGHDVLVARFKVSEYASYAMFAGGGASWAEARMKDGSYSVEKAAPGDRPDLTGLSCRWSPITSRHGEIVSIIAVPARDDDDPRFRELIRNIVAVSASEERAGHPVPVDGLTAGLVQGSLELEARAQARKGHRLRPRLIAVVQAFVVNTFSALNIPFGKFDARRYKQEVSDNSDFRKFDDGLKMTVDVDAERFGRIETLLKQAAADGICRYGLHRQDSALITCFAINPMQRDHIHFIDGASGGYALAAAKMKEMVSPSGLAAVTP